MNACSGSTAGPEELLARLAADTVRVLEGELMSLTPHGSWVLGDFCPDRSDLDLLAVMATYPKAATITALQEVHARLGRDFPEWDGRVEVEYVPIETIRAVVQGTHGPHPMITVGGGEPFHEAEASRHLLLNWAAALHADRPIVGVAPSTVLPAIDGQLIHQVVLEHVRWWPGLVDGERLRAGEQAYAVLTLCRAAEALATGSQVSKLVAARSGVVKFPEWSALMTWARQWWYNGGSDLDQGHSEEVRRFVNDISARLPRDFDTGPASI